MSSPRGLGGGLLAALGYILVRSIFAEALWPRVFGLLASVWSVTVLVGPLIGGIFAGYGYWRGAFFTVAGAAGLLAISAFIVFPPSTREDHQSEYRFPFFRVVLICAYIAFFVAGERVSRSDGQRRAHCNRRRSVRALAPD